jgi:hypothetical protein
MRFHVQGTDAQTGQQISTFFEAPTREEAAQMATERGIIIQSIADNPIYPVSTASSSAYPSQAGNNPFAESFANTWSAWKVLVKNPVEGIGIASQAIGEPSLLQVGLVCGIFYILSQVFLFNRLLPIVINIIGGIVVSFLGTFGSLPSSDSLSDSLGFDFYVKIAILAAVPVATLTLGLFLARKISKAPPSINTDIFGAGISFLPTTLIYTVIAILTPQSWEFIFVLFLWSLCVSILMTYHCFTVLSQLPSRLAVYAVPLTAFVNVILTRIVGDILF